MQVFATSPPVDHRSIRNKVLASVGEECIVEFFDELKSTNDFLLKQRNSNALPQVCIADRQVQGKGRRGKAWITPCGGVTFSIRRSFQLPASELACMSLVVGCAAVDGLSASGYSEIELKWPNDLYWHGRKLGGILIEISDSCASASEIVTGVGINYIDPTLESNIDQPAVDLASMGQAGIPDRRELLTTLIGQILLYQTEYQRYGFKAFGKQWQHLDYLAGKQVLIDSGSNAYFGTARGIDNSGALLVEVNGQLRNFTSGTVSVRCANGPAD